MNPEKVVTGFPSRRQGQYTLRAMSHAPPAYTCPFCLLAAGKFGPPLLNRASEVIYRDAQVVAFMTAGQFSTGSGYPGHVLIIPARHFENIYVLPDETTARIQALARRMSLAFKHLGCEGTSTRQHNEPAGNQDVWHDHLHVFPRWANDNLYRQQRTQPANEVREHQAA